MAEPLLVVGLGNPGPQYAKTRHNIGFMVADILAARVGGSFKVHKKSGAEVVTGRLGHRPVVLAKPRCYMNESGRQVGPLAKFYSVPAADVIVIHDELDIDFGRVRLKLYKGSASVIGRASPDSLYSLAHVTFEEDDVYDQHDAEGFIKLNALRLRLARRREG